MSSMCFTAKVQSLFPAVIIFNHYKSQGFQHIRKQSDNTFWMVEEKRVRGRLAIESPTHPDKENQRSSTEL